MPKHKSTTIISEVSKFFKENDATKAMSTIMDMTGILRLSEKRLFASESKPNCKVAQRQVLELLLLFPCFMVKNAYRYAGSAMESIVRCGKDVFYRFLSNGENDWRKILYSASKRLWAKIQSEGTASGHGITCLMIDDTDFPKRGGVHTEAIGKVFSHVTHKMILGFKGLFLGITDGKSQMLLDFALVGEKGRKGDHGMRKDQLGERYSKERREGCPVMERLKEYDRSKIALAVEMIRRAISLGMRFRYMLADSWFTCAEVVRFVRSRRIGCHYLGMAKMGKTKYDVNGKMMTAREIVSSHGTKKTGRRYSRGLRCHYITVDASLDGVDVRLFLSRRGDRSDWTLLLTTDTSIDFAEACRTYSMRWSLEVVFKDSKQNLGLGKYQVRDFASQIACTSITALQYNLLSTALRFSDYETLGGLFRDAVQNSTELSVTDHIWDATLEIVYTISECFNIPDDEILDIIVNKTVSLENVINIYTLKYAS